MSIFDKVQSTVASDDGKLFDLSFHTDEISFKIIELTHQEITELLSCVEEQVTLLEESYQSSTPKVEASG